MKKLILSVAVLASLTELAMANTNYVSADASFTIPASDYIDVAHQPPVFPYKQKAQISVPEGTHEITCTVQNIQTWVNPCQEVGIKITLDSDNVNNPLHTACGVDQPLIKNTYWITNYESQSAVAMINAGAEAEFNIAQPQDVNISCSMAY